MLVRRSSDLHHQDPLQHQLSENSQTMNAFSPAAQTPRKGDGMQRSNAKPTSGAGIVDEDGIPGKASTKSKAGTDLDLNYLLLVQKSMEGKMEQDTSKHRFLSAAAAVSSSARQQRNTMTTTEQQLNAPWEALSGGVKSSGRGGASPSRRRAVAKSAADDNDDRQVSIRELLLTKRTFGTAASPWHFLPIQEDNNMRRKREMRRLQGRNKFSKAGIGNTPAQPVPVIPLPKKTSSTPGMLIAGKESRRRGRGSHRNTNASSSSENPHHSSSSNSKSHYTTSSRKKEAAAIPPIKEEEEEQLDHSLRSASHHAARSREYIVPPQTPLRSKVPTLSSAGWTKDAVDPSQKQHPNQQDSGERTAANDLPNGDTIRNESKNYAANYLGGTAGAPGGAAPETPRGTETSSWANDLLLKNNLAGASALGDVRDFTPSSTAAVAPAVTAKDFDRLSGMLNKISAHFTQSPSGQTFSSRSSMDADGELSPQRRPVISLHRHVEVSPLTAEISIPLTEISSSEIESNITSPERADTPAFFSALSSTVSELESVAASHYTEYLVQEDLDDVDMDKYRQLEVRRAMCFQIRRSLVRRDIFNHLQAYRQRRDLTRQAAEAADKQQQIDDWLREFTTTHGVTSDEEKMAEQILRHAVRKAVDAWGSPSEDEELARIPRTPVKRTPSANFPPDAMESESEALVPSVMDEGGGGEVDHMRRRHHEDGTGLSTASSNNDSNQEARLRASAAMSSEAQMREAEIIRRLEMRRTNAQFTSPTAKVSGKTKLAATVSPDSEKSHSSQSPRPPQKKKKKKDRKLSPLGMSSSPSTEQSSHSPMTSSETQEQRAMMKLIRLELREQGELGGNPETAEGTTAPSEGRVVEVEDTTRLVSPPTASSSSGSKKKKKSRRNVLDSAEGDALEKSSRSTRSSSAHRSHQSSNGTNDTDALEKSNRSSQSSSGRKHRSSSKRSENMEKSNRSSRSSSERRSSSKTKSRSVVDSPEKSNRSTRSSSGHGESLEKSSRSTRSSSGRRSSPKERDQLEKSNRSTRSSSGQRSSSKHGDLLEKSNRSSRSSSGHRSSRHEVNEKSNRSSRSKPADAIEEDENDHTDKMDVDVDLPYEIIAKPTQAFRSVSMDNHNMSTAAEKPSLASRSVSANAAVGHHRRISGSSFSEIAEKSTRSTRSSSQRRTEALDLSSRSTRSAAASGPLRHQHLHAGDRRSSSSSNASSRFEQKLEEAIRKQDFVRKQETELGGKIDNLGATPDVSPQLSPVTNVFKPVVQSLPKLPIKVVPPPPPPPAAANNAAHPNSWSAGFGAPYKEPLKDDHDRRKSIYGGEHSSVDTMPINNTSNHHQRRNLYGAGASLADSKDWTTDEDTRMDTSISSRDSDDDYSDSESGSDSETNGEEDEEDSEEE